LRIHCGRTDNQTGIGFQRFFLADAITIHSANMPLCTIHKFYIVIITYRLLSEENFSFLIFLCTPMLGVLLFRDHFFSLQTPWVFLYRWLLVVEGFPGISLCISGQCKFAYEKVKKNVGRSRCSIVASNSFLRFDQYASEFVIFAE